MRKKTKTFLIVGGAASIVVWLCMLFWQFSVSLECAPDDQLCNSANTIIGDVVWTTFLAAPIVGAGWVLALAAVLISKRYRKK